MEGIVFTLMEDVLTEEHGTALWDGALVHAGVHGGYTSVAAYPDEQLRAIVGAVATRLGTTAQVVLRDGGRGVLPRFAERFPDLFARYADPRGFALGLNHVIHPAVRRRLPQAAPPALGFDTRSPRTLVVHYRSRRRMCAFAEGLLLGLGDHYLHPVELAQPRCMLHGDDACELEMTPA